MAGYTTSADYCTPVADDLHHPTEDSARVSALPEPSEQQDNETNHPETGTVRLIPYLSFLFLTIRAE
jgi:hypothetical protein